jgi:hypothetical protein
MRTLSAIHLLLAASLFANAGCTQLSDGGWHLQNQSWCCWDDPRIGEYDPGRGCPCLWDNVTDEVLIVTEVGPTCFNKCAERIQEDLDAYGIRSRILLPNDVLLASRDLFAIRMSGQLRTPVIIIGCGNAADDALRLCRSLDSMHQPVEQLILLGNNCCERVPDNIALCVNIYNDQHGIPLLCREKPVFSDCGGSQVFNYNLARSGTHSQESGTGETGRDLAVQHVLGLIHP